jgi:hypothetical protein
MEIKIHVGAGYSLLVSEELFLLLNIIITTMIGIIVGIGIVTLFH